MLYKYTFKVVEHKSVAVCLHTVILCWLEIIRMIKSNCVLDFYSAILLIFFVCFKQVSNHSTKLSKVRLINSPSTKVNQLHHEIAREYCHLIGTITKQICERVQYKASRKQIVLM